MFHIVLLEPEIPANTGNIGRTCLVTGSSLHLIEPLGFILNDKNLKRAGMDYWKDLNVTVYDSWRDFVWKKADEIAFPLKTLQDAGYPGLTSEGNLADPAEEDPEKARIWMASTKAPCTHDSASFRDGDYIMFGKESAGIPEEILKDNLNTTVRIPMARGQRSLNLSNSAAIVLYEALRQNHYLQLEQEGKFYGTEINQRK